MKGMYTCTGREVPEFGNTAVLRPTHYLFLSGSTLTAAQALPLLHLISFEPYFEAKPPRRERGTQFGCTARFETFMYGCCTSEHQTPEEKHKVNLRTPLDTAVREHNDWGCYGKNINRIGAEGQKRRRGFATSLFWIQGEEGSVFTSISQIILFSFL